MIDLATDLRKWANTFNDVSCAPQLRKAADEIERLREIEQFLRDDLPDSKKWVERAEALLSNSTPTPEGSEKCLSTR